jgi:hypothetical protein
VVRPYIRNKAQKTFFDHWFLGADLSTGVFACSCIFVLLMAVRLISFCTWLIWCCYCACLFLPPAALSSRACSCCVLAASYAEPFAYGKLNVLEKILLGIRVSLVHRLTDCFEQQLCSREGARLAAAKPRCCACLAVCSAPEAQHLGPASE